MLVRRIVEKSNNFTFRLFLTVSDQFYALIGERFEPLQIVHEYRDDH